MSNSEAVYNLMSNSEAVYKPQKKRATVTQAAALLIHNFYLAINKIDL